MKQRKITKQQARRFLLASQDLLPPRLLRGKQGILDYIARVGCIQYDPLDIAGHNQELVLQARIDGFRPSLLDELLYGDRLLLEGWDKNMSIYRTQDWPSFGRVHAAAQQRLEHGDTCILQAIPAVRQAIAERGPLSSGDLAMPTIVDWSWSPTTLSRAALESMYFAGELVVHHRTRTRKTYDLTERCLPRALLEAPDPHATQEAYQDWRILRRIGGIGLVWDRPGDAWLGMHHVPAAARTRSIQRLLRRGDLLRLQVEDMPEPLYISADRAQLLDSVCRMKAVPRKAAILAPLDNLLWDRRLIRELFGFDYLWEVYKPAQERRYGYYVLPVLYGDRFIGRIEPRRDREKGVLCIDQQWWEQGVRRSAVMEKALEECLEDFGAFLGMQELRIAGTSR